MVVVVVVMVVMVVVRRRDSSVRLCALQADRKLGWRSKSHRHGEKSDGVEPSSRARIDTTAPP